MLGQNIKVRVTGQTGHIDGHVEMILGMLTMTAQLLNYSMFKRVRPDGTTQVFLDLMVRPAPLGNLGESDIPDAPEGFEDV